MRQIFIYISVLIYFDSNAQFLERHYYGTRGGNFDLNTTSGDIAFSSLIYTAYNTVDSLFTSSEKPTTLHEDIGTTLGMSFTTSVSGNITAIKFYKTDAGTTPYTYTLWSLDGAKLYQTTLSTSKTGWQRIPCNVPVTGSAFYMVSVYNNGRYGYTNNIYPRVRGSLKAVAGTFLRGSNGLPTVGSTTWYGLDVVFAEERITPLIVNAGIDTSLLWPTDSIKLNGIVTGDSVKYYWLINNQWGSIVVTGTNTLTPVVKFKEPDSGVVLQLIGTDKRGNMQESLISVSVLPDLRPYIQRFGELFMNQLKLDLIRRYKAGE